MTRQELAAKIADRLALVYKERAFDLAEACDEKIDRSGNLLGWIRDYAALRTPETKDA